MNAPETDADWAAVCPLDDVPKLGARVLPVPAGDIALFRNGADEVFALHDRCPHRGGPLSQGIVHDHSVTCPLHGRRIDLSSGNVVAPDTGCARRFDVKLQDRVVFLRVSQLTAANAATDPPAAA